MLGLIFGVSKDDAPHLRAEAADKREAAEYAALPHMLSLGGSFSQLHKMLFFISDANSQRNKSSLYYYLSISSYGGQKIICPGNVLVLCCDLFPATQW
jgi:hypothetical protein